MVGGRRFAPSQRLSSALAVCRGDRFVYLCLGTGNRLLDAVPNVSLGGARIQFSSWLQDSFAVSLMRFRSSITSAYNLRFRSPQLTVRVNGMRSALPSVVRPTFGRTSLPGPLTAARSGGPTGRPGWWSFKVAVLAAKNVGRRSGTRFAIVQQFETVPANRDHVIRL